MRNLILAELGQASRIEQRHVEAFAKHDVDLLDLAASGIRRAWVIFDGARFEFARHVRGGTSRAAFIWPAWNAYGELADLICWRPGRDLATWLGAVGCAGEEQICAPRLCEPLTVHPDPMSWFRAKRQGIVILDFARAADLLRSETLAAQSAAHARYLKERLTVQPPPIRVVYQQQQSPDQKLTASVAEAYA